MKKFGVILLCAMLLFGSMAFATEQPLIGILAPATTHGWVAAVAYNAQNKAEEMGLNYKIYTSSNADEMTSQLDDLLAQGAKAIVMFPQWTGMELPVSMAVEQGVYIVNFDIAIDVEGVYRLSGDNYDMGVQGANYMAEKLEGKGKVIILEVPTAGSVSDLRKAGFLDTLPTVAPGIEVIGTYATQFTREAGLQDMADILVANPEIDAVYSMDDETSIGAIQAILESGRTDIKIITGGGGCQEYFEMMPLNPTIWVQSALYSPAMVRECVEMAVKLAAGEAVEKVIILPTTIVDRDNCQDYLDANSPY